MKNGVEGKDKECTEGDGRHWRSKTSRGTGRAAAEGSTAYPEEEVKESTTESKEKTGADSKGEKDLDFRYESHITRDRSSQHGDHRGSSWLLSPLSELTRAIVHVLCIC